MVSFFDSRSFYKETSSMFKHIVSLAILTGLLLSIVSSGINPAAAQTYFNQTGPAAYETPSDWSSGSVPTSATNAYIGGSGGFTATLGSTESVSNLYLGTNSSCPSLPSPASTYEGPGTLNMTGGTLSLGASVYVGYASTGVLTIGSGATLNSPSVANYIGSNVAGNTSSGTVTISGTGSWTGTPQLIVGTNGPGYVNIDSGGTLGNLTSGNGNSLIIGNGTGATGSSVTVDGVGGSSTLDYMGAGGITVSAKAPASLLISNGGTVNTYKITGNSTTAGTNATVSVTGGSTLSTNPTNDATANANFGGGLSGSQAATITVDGYNSQWNCGIHGLGVIIGGAGSGTLNITNGGSLTSLGYDNEIGSNGPGDACTVTIDGSSRGAFSTWTITQNAADLPTILYIGKNNTSTVNITNGGVINNTVYSGTTTTVASFGAALSGVTLVGTAASSPGAGPGSIVLGSGGTLNTTSLFAAPSQITGSGTINANGLVTDGAVTFSAATGLTGSVAWSSPVAVNLNMSNVAANGVLGAGYAGTGTLSISGETVTSRVGYLGYKSSSSGTAVVSGSNAEWIVAGAQAALYVGASGSTTYTNSRSYGTGALYICGGGTVTAPIVGIGSSSLLEIDAGPGSSLTVGGGTGTLTNNGTVRMVAGADATAGQGYVPISAAAVGGTVQAVGGTWSSPTFTPSSVTTVASGTAATMDLCGSDTPNSQRLLVTNGGASLGVSFLAATSTTNITPSASVLAGSALTSLTADLAALIGSQANQAVLNGWTLSAGPNEGYTAGLPAYLSLSTGRFYYPTPGFELWSTSNGGSTWSPITPNDLTFDGTYVSFGTTASLDNCGYALSGISVLPGDANEDGKVDINDLTVVLTNYDHTGASWSMGDFIGDGTVDINDLTIVLTNYGDTSGSSAAGMAAVPEPAGLSLLAAGLVGLLACAWRKRK
jgi:T5SS/PEP-CTERM-associated repeat protein